jgi:hypothetical protein
MALARTLNTSAQQLTQPPGASRRVSGARVLVAAVAAVAAVVSLTLAAVAITPRPQPWDAPAASDAFAVSASGAGLAATNAAEGLRVTFRRAGMRVRSPGSTLSMTLRGVGYGARASSVAAVTPAASGRRVDYLRPGVDEWYLNGPSGLEQGFDIARPPVGAPRGPLTLSLGLSGTSAPRLLAGGRSLAAGGLRYAGLSALDANGKHLHAWLALHAHRLLIQVDTRGARYPVRIDPFVQQGPKVTGLTSGVDYFGSSVALSADGSTALVAAPVEGGGRGAVWVFTHTGSGWSEQTQLLGPGGSAGAFGSSVALSGDGNTALIGASGEAGGEGGAWVFTRSGSSWAQQGPMLAGHEAASRSGFGSAVAISSDGDTALIGAPGTSGEGGSAWIFSRIAGSWSTGPQITPAGESGAGAFGRSLALSPDGSTAAVAGPSDSSGTGAVWTYGRSGSQWLAAGEKIVGSGVPLEGQFGWRVALSGDGSTLLVTDHAPFGAAWVFARSGEQWAQQGDQFTDSLEGESNYFGTGGAALSADGNTALIGAPQFFTFGGLAFRFTRSGTTWAQQGGWLEGKEEMRPSNFGESVALSSDARTALIGGFEASGIGAAWFFANPPSAPVLEPRPASAVTATGATLNASINPEGSGVEDCHFEYGTTTAYGLQAPCAPSPGSGISALEVSAQIVGLHPGTVYHFRVAATNPIGTSHGTDRTFATPANPPVVLSVAPSAGPTAGGTQITISGTALQEAGSVHVGAASATFQVLSPTSLTATTPPGAGTADVTVTTPEGTSLAGAADRFTYLPAPSVTKVSPKKAPSRGGTGITITGSNLGQVTDVSFGGVPATSFTVASPTSIVAFAPAHTTGTVDIRVAGAGGASTISSKDRFSYEAPAITGISPGTGPAAGGTFVTVSGSGFSVVPGATVLMFGKTAGSAVTCSSISQCSALSPAARVGAVDVVATVAGKKSPKGTSDRFTYH